MIVLKRLIIIGLGIFIWGLSLLWPEINQLLTPRIMVGTVLGLGTIYMARIWWQRHQLEASVEASRNEAAPAAEIPTQINDTRPLKPLGLA